MDETYRCIVTYIPVQYDAIIKSSLWAWSSMKGKISYGWGLGMVNIHFKYASNPNQFQWDLSGIVHLKRHVRSHLIFFTIL